MPSHTPYGLTDEESAIVFAQEATFPVSTTIPGSAYMFFQRLAPMLGNQELIKRLEAVLDEYQD